MKLEQAVKIANKVRGNGATGYTLPDEKTSVIAEALHEVNVALTRYRRAFEAFNKTIADIECVSKSDVEAVEEPKINQEA